MIQSVIAQIDKISQDHTTNYQTDKSKHQTNEINQINQFQQQMTVVKIANLMVDDVIHSLQRQILNGSLIIEDQKQQFPVEKKFQPIKKSASSIQQKMEQIDFEEHRRKVKQMMRMNKKFRQRLNNRTLQTQKSLKKLETEEQIKQRQQKQKQLQRRRMQISKRMTAKSQLMRNIKKMSLQTDQKLKQVKTKSFLYQQKQKQFKSQFILPKIQQQKKILQRRKNKMKSIDMKQLLDHEKSYQIKLKQNTINRSMTSRIVKSQNQYTPPPYIPKSYLIYQAQQNLKKEQQILKQKQTQINKLKLKQFVKQVFEIHKMEHQIQKSRLIQKSRAISPEAVESNPEQKKKKSPVKKLTKEQATNMGNNYFKQLLKQIKQVKQKKLHHNKLKQKKQKKQNQQFKQQKSPQQLLELQIRSQQIKTIQKIQKIQRIHRVRSKKIEQIFNDQKIHPLVKYQKLQHQVQKLDNVLKNKNFQSKDIHQRNQAAGCYLDAIKAKLKLLEASTPK